MPEDVTVWTKNTTGGFELDIDTIFEIPPQPLYGADGNSSNATNSTVPRYWRNMRSTVRMGDYSFRNPVSFHDLVEPNRLDAEYVVGGVVAPGHTPNPTQPNPTQPNPTRSPP